MVSYSYSFNESKEVRAVFAIAIESAGINLISAFALVLIDSIVPAETPIY